MVSTTYDSDNNSRFDIRPNHSLSRRHAAFFYGSIAALSLSVAVGFAAMGFWPVLPFAGLELLGLGVALYVTARRLSVHEVVSVDAVSVAVERGRQRLDPCWDSPRAWAQVKLLKPAARWYPSRLVLRSHGRQIELGSFLEEKERKRLARDLRRAISS